MRDINSFYNEVKKELEVNRLVRVVTSKNYSDFKKKYKDFDGIKHVYVNPYCREMVNKICGICATTVYFIDDGAWGDLPFADDVVEIMELHNKVDCLCLFRNY